MENILEQAQLNTREAFAMLRRTRAVAAWELQGAEVKVVGSLACGLYYDSRDIDLHVYTGPADIETGFKAMAFIARQKGVKRITYANLLDAPDACCEWHVACEDETGREWTLDIIHIDQSSRYAGYFEKQAELIRQMLTDETKTAVLNIKKSLSGRKEHICGIWIYVAVLRDGVRTPEEFVPWYAGQDKNQIIEWPQTA